MAVIDLGEFETSLPSAALSGPTFRRVRIHVMHVTESERDESCSSCAAPLPKGSEFYIVGGRIECARTFEARRAALKPARGFGPEERFGGEQLRRPQRPWRHRVG
jgi:hypothetical protein